MNNKILQVVFLFISFILGSAFFAAGMALFLAPIGLLMDLLDSAEGWNGLATFLGLSGCAGLAFGAGTMWFLYHLDSQLVMPEMDRGETVRFRQYGYAITDKKYDPARIVVTDRRVIILPTHFNSGPKIPDFVAKLSDLRVSENKNYGSSLAGREVQVIKDRCFGEEISGRFLLLKFKNKIVFHTGSRKIAYMSNIGYPLPPLKLFRPGLASSTTTTAP